MAQYCAMGIEVDDVVITRAALVSDLLQVISKCLVGAWTQDLDINRQIRLS
jgi:hypothetical protein